MRDGDKIWLPAGFVFAFANMRGSSLTERALIGYIIVNSRRGPRRVNLAAYARRSGHNAASVRVAWDALVNDGIIVSMSVGCYINTDYRTWAPHRLTRQAYEVAESAHMGDNTPPEPIPAEPQPEPSPAVRLPDDKDAMIAMMKEAIRRLSDEHTI